MEALGKVSFEEQVLVSRPNSLRKLYKERKKKIDPPSQLLQA